MYLLALVAPMFSSSCRVFSVVAGLAQSTTGVSKVSRIGETSLADLTQETIGVPRSAHRLDHTTDDELVCETK